MRRAIEHLEKHKQILRTDAVARALARGLATGLETGEDATRLWQVAESLGIAKFVEKELENRAGRSD